MLLLVVIQNTLLSNFHSITFINFEIRTNMEAIAQSPNISHDTYLRIQITLDVLVAAVVVIRLLTNYGYTRKLAIDDCKCKASSPLS